MRFRRASILAAALALSLSACGDDSGGDDGAAQGTEDGTAGGDTREPHGELRADGVGSVSLGATREEVREAFGPPERTEEVNLGLGPAPQLDWIWTLDGGEIRLQFETRGDSLRSYRCEAATLATEDGFKVGDSLKELRNAYGGRLAEDVIGAGNLLLDASESSAGRPALGFAIEGREIVSIYGGEVQPAGE